MKLICRRLTNRLARRFPSIGWRPAFNFAQSQGVRSFLASLGLFTFGLGIGTFLLAFLLAGDIYDYEDSIDLDDLPRVDAIVCLGGGRGRIAAAGEIWQRYRVKRGQAKAPILYFSGMGKQTNWSLLGKQIEAKIVDEIPTQLVVIEKESFNTIANAHWLIQYARIHHWKKILLLTSSYHMRRAVLIFEEVLRISDYPLEIETLSVVQEPFQSRKWKGDLNGVRVTLLEYAKWVYYRVLLKSL